MDQPLRKYRAQLATLVERPPMGSAWIHELKYDGYRIACHLHEGKVRLESRRNNDWTDKFPEVAAAAAQLPARAAVLDGEVAIVLPSSGATSFQALQNSFSGSSRAGLTYFVFDLLHLDGQDVAALPLEHRKSKCAQLLAAAQASAVLRYSEHFDVDGPAFLARACALGAEGIVSKRRDQPYRPGRNDDWLKAKCVKRQEFVIGGFTEPAGSRSGIGSLLVGYYEESRLRFAGKVGTGPGFTAEYLARIRRELDALERVECPFDPRPPGALGRTAHWVEPVRTGEVIFTEWTDAGHVRHPSFQGFREDKPAAEVTRERAARSRKTEKAISPAPSAISTGATAPCVLGISISSPKRLIYPALGFTKLQLAELYADLAHWSLPHLMNRPLTLVRCEKGVRGPDALRQDCRFLPHEEAWYRWASPPLRRVQIQEQTKLGEYLVVDSAEALVALAQGDIVEIHAWNSTVDHLEQPDRIVIDLDPGTDVEWERVVQGARVVRDVLADLGLSCWPKLTGGKGIHVVVPFQPDFDWESVYLLARRIAEAAVQRQPNWFTLDFSKHGRSKRILLDYKRNHRGAVAVATYSTRAHPNGSLSMPIAWRELKASLHPQQWTVANVRGRLSRLKADPWSEFWTSNQTLRR